MDMECTGPAEVVNLPFVGCGLGPRARELGVGGDGGSCAMLRYNARSGCPETLLQ